MPDAEFESFSDIELVEKAKTNPDFFTPLVRRWQERLFFYVRRISYFNTEDAEDLVQETFLKVYRYLNDYDQSFAFSTWLYRIARNTVFDAIRARKARPHDVYLEETEAVSLFLSQTDISKKIVQKDSFAMIVSLIQALPYKYKEVMVLRYLEEKTYEEIMDIIQKPKGTVAALLNRARKQIVSEARRLRVY
ncbi:MAG: sigma-70 family RNA polymerase sigma factor [Candidatus Moranbacteria bacterium]|nr:sigma-70 family RNA polymerase sigma factor [Candidatus Moranbacteria bacterium]